MSKMNTLGLSTIISMGCFCFRETVNINGIIYTIKQELAVGGFSTIYLVEHKRTNEVYAMKKITCYSIDDQNTARQEINYYKHLRHPNIINLVDSTIKGSADIVVNETSDVFLLFPYFRRGTLHDYLTSKAKLKQHLSIAEIFRIFTEICEAIRYLHGFTPEPIAHRDIKTHNILLTDTYMPVLMDLGSCAPAKIQICGAQDAQRLQDIAAERCSMTYRAPELFHVESYCIIDQRVDIWSLGCLLYAMLYYKSPYDVIYERGDSVNLGVISGNISFPEETPFPKELHDLILFMLKVNPSERPYIHEVIEKTHELKNKLEGIV